MTQERPLSPLRRFLPLIALGLGALLVYVVMSAILKGSPCSELLDEVDDKHLKDLSFDERSEFDHCSIVLSTKERTQRIRVYAVTTGPDRMFDFAKASLAARGFDRTEPLDLGDASILAIAAEPKDDRACRAAEGDTTMWLEPDTRLLPPCFHVALVEKDEALLSVEIDARKYTGEDAAKIVESMKPALKEMKRLRRR